MATKLDTKWYELCRKVVNTNSSITGAIVIAKPGICLAGNFRKEVSDSISKQLYQKSIKDTISRWESRMIMGFVIGIPQWSVTKYEREYRITIPVGPNELLLVEAELGADIEKLVDDIQLFGIGHKNILPDEQEKYVISCPFCNVRMSLASLDEHVKDHCK